MRLILIAAPAELEVAMGCISEPLAVDWGEEVDVVLVEDEDDEDDEEDSMSSGDRVEAS